MVDDEFEPDEFERAEEPAADGSGKGVVVNKSRLAEITGLALATIDRHVADGAPIIAKGSRKAGWKINTAAFFDHFWRRKVMEATKGAEDDSMAAVEIRSKEANAKLKEANEQLRQLTLARELKQTIYVEELRPWLREKFATIRSRFLAVPQTLPDLTPEQHATLVEAINDALEDVSGTKGDGPNADD